MRFPDSEKTVSLSGRCTVIPVAPIARSFPNTPVIDLRLFIATVFLDGSRPPCPFSPTKSSPKYITNCTTGLLRPGSIVTLHTTRLCEVARRSYTSLESDFYPKDPKRRVNLNFYAGAAWHSPRIAPH